MTTSILLRPPPFPNSPSSSPSHSPSPSPSPVSTPLPALQADLSSSSSSASGSYLDLHRASSAPSTRHIRFAPLPEPDRELFDLHDPSSDPPQSDTKPDTKLATQPVPAPDDSPALSPSVSPDSTLSSVRSTPTIRLSPNTPSKDTRKSNLRLLRPFSFLRRADSSSTHSASLPSSRNPSLSSLTRASSSLPNSPSFQSARLPRISTEDLFSFSRMSLFRPRSGSCDSSHHPRSSSPPPKPSKSSKSLHRSSSTSSAPAMKQVDGKRDLGEGSSSAAIAGSGSKKRRASSSASTPGAGGGRHSSVKSLPNNLPVRPSTAPSPSSVPARPQKHVKMLNGRVYGAKRYAAQTLANPFANVRDEPEFVEWGYGGMGSVQASAGIANDMWKGLQRSERGGALFAGSSPGSPSASARPAVGVVTPGGGRGGGSPISRRKMSVDIPECGMGNVPASAGVDEDDGSGMTWVKRRRAEREAKARLEQEAKELERKMQEKRRSSDSMDASMYASTASTTTSLTACTSVASTDLTTPTTSPLTSRSPSVTDLKLPSSPSEPPNSHSVPSSPVTGKQSSNAVTAHTLPVSKDEHAHHVLTAVRLSPNILSSSHKHDRAPLSLVDTETATGTNSSGDEEEEQDGDDDNDDDDDDDEHEAQDISRKTALGAGVEKISRHVDVEAP